MADKVGIGTVMNKGKEILERMKSNSEEMVIGGHVFLNEPSIGQALGYFGYDFIWVDAEHGPMDNSDILSHVIYINETGAAAFVRVHTNHPDVIKQELEMGVDGIIIPMIKNAEDAQRAVSACFYPPKGIRGFGPRRAQKYGAVPVDKYLEDVDESFLRILQIENKEAVDNIDKIMEVDGISAFVIGPCDLSASLGLLGNPVHPRVLEYAKRTIEKAKQKNIPIGVSIAPVPSVIDIWKKLGVSFISCGDELSFMQKGAEETIEYIRRKK